MHLLQKKDEKKHRPNARVSFMITVVICSFNKDRQSQHVLMGLWCKDLDLQIKMQQCLKKESFEILKKEQKTNSILQHTTSSLQIIEQQN